MKVDIELCGFLCRRLRRRLSPPVPLVGLLCHVVCGGAPCAVDAVAPIYQICKNGDALHYVVLHVMEKILLVLQKQVELPKLCNLWNTI